MVAFGLLRTALVVFGLLAPPILASPTGAKTVVTPFGELPVEIVHAVPQGMPSGMKTAALYLTLFVS